MFAEAHRQQTALAPSDVNNHTFQSLGIANLLLLILLINGEQDWCIWPYNCLLQSLLPVSSCRSRHVATFSLMTIYKLETRLAAS